MSNGTQTARHTQQQSKRVRQSKAQLLGALAELSARRDASDALVSELSAKLEELKVKLVKAEGDVAMLRSDAEAVRPCSPGGPPAAAALQPTQEGIMFLWAMVKGEAYKIGFAGQDMNGKRWTWTAFTDGRKYTLCETDANTITCTCPGQQKYGPHCAGGRSCKHVRQLRAARAVVSNMGPKFSTTPPAVAKTPQAIIDEEHDDCFAGVKTAA